MKQMRLYCAISEKPCHIKRKVQLNPLVILEEKKNKKKIGGPRLI